MLAGQQVEAEALHLPAEVARVRMQPLAQLRVALEQIEHLAACRAATGGAMLLENR